MTSQPHLTGGCVCGAVSIAISAPLQDAGYCHCTRCQRRTGTAASPGGRLAPGSFTITQGAEHVTEWAPPDGSIKAFCARCGGHLYARRPDDPEPAAVRLGAIDGDPGVRPSYHQHAATAAVWEPLPDDGLARFEGGRTG